MSARAAVAAFALALAGCAGLPPQTTAPRLPTSLPLAAPAADAQAGEWPATDWWRAYGDATLDELVQRAQAQSPSIATARSRVDAATGKLAIVSAGRGLTATASAGAQRIRLSDNGLLPPKFLGFNWYDQFDVGASVRYDLDWWGRERAQIGAALSRSRAAQVESEAARLALAAAVVDAYLGWQADQQHIRLASDRLALGQQQLDIAQRRLGAGLERDDAVQRAASAAAANEEMLAGYQAAAQLHRVVLAALVGCRTDELPALEPRALPSPLARLPDNASIDLIGRRPDIVASRARVEAALHDAREARAQFLPDISLSALAGLSSIRISRLIEAGSAAPSAGLALRLPLFDSGALKGQYAARRAQLDSAVADYRQTLIDAARQVGEQLARRQELANRNGARANELVAAGRLLAIARERVEHGLGDRRSELEAQQQLLDQQSALLDLQSASLSTDVALFQALGGGFDNNGKS
jgi:multidrug efflux system outer membrane protein